MEAAVEKVQDVEEGVWYETAVLDPIGGHLELLLRCEASSLGDALAG